MKDFQAVVFDLDGTLADSLADIADAMNRTLNRLSYPTYDYETYKYFVGNGLKKLAFRAIPENKRDDSHVEECLTMMMEEYNKTCIDKTRLYDGIPELLHYLSEKGMKLNVLSNKADELTQKITAVLLKDYSFEIILGASEQFPRKPSPESALYIAQRNGIAPEHFLYLGDTNVDMQTAVAAGMFPVGVTWGFRTREELQQNGARLIIDHPEELISIIK